MNLQETKKVASNMQLIKIIDYLLNESKVDNYLKQAIEKVNDKDFMECWNYIYEQVQERAKAQIEAQRQAGGNCACVMFDDSQVYSLAKEYFIDYEQIQKIKADKKAKEEKEKAEREAKAKEKSKKSDTTTKKATPKKVEEDSEEDDEEDLEEEIKDNKSKKIDQKSKTAKPKAEKKVDPMEEIRKLAEERKKKMQQMSLFDFE